MEGIEQQFRQCRGDQHRRQSLQQARPGDAPAVADQRRQIFAVDPAHGDPQAEPDAREAQQGGDDDGGRRHERLDKPLRAGGGAAADVEVGAGDDGGKVPASQTSDGEGAEGKPRQRRSRWATGDTGRTRRIDRHAVPAETAGFAYGNRGERTAPPLGSRLCRGFTSGHAQRSAWRRRPAR